MAAPTPAGSSSSGGLTPTVAALAAGVTGTYQQAELQLIQDTAAIIRNGASQGQGVAGRLGMLRILQDVARRIAYRLAAQSGPLAQQVIRTAQAEGTAAAGRQLRQAAERDPRLRGILTRPVVGDGPTALGEWAANAIQLDLQSKLENAALRITAFADDAYRAATAQAATQLVLSNLTPVEAQAAAWRDLTARGVTGFTDQAGRDWNLATYVEMAVRTTAARAFNDGHLARMTQNNVHYFTVSDTGRPCHLCFPWEGQVLSDVHPAGETSTLAADRDELVTFTIAATIDEARAAGLQHPNCGHTFVPYLPGVTKLHPREWGPAQDAAYTASQRLRALERMVRAAKLQQAGALSPADELAAKRRVRALQGRIREHVASTGVMRRPRREQLNLGNHP